MLKHLTSMNNSFKNNNNKIEKELIKQIVAQFHIKNGKTHFDKSMGEIKITPKQLRNSLAYIVQTIKK